MIMNKGLMSPANPFRSYTFASMIFSVYPDNTPIAIKYSPEAGRWLGIGHDGNNAVLWSIQSVTSKKIIKLNNIVQTPSGVGYSSTGYLVIPISSQVGWVARYAATTIENVTSSTAFSTYSASYATGQDIVISGAAAQIPNNSSRTSSRWPGAAYTASVPSFSIGEADRWTNDGTYPHRVCVHGSRVAFISPNGSLAYKSSISAQHFGGNPDRNNENYLVAGTTTGIHTTHIASFGGYLIVAGWKEVDGAQDGLYIWYSNSTLGQSMTWTEKKISDRVGNVIAIGYLSNCFVVAHTDSEWENPRLWYSKKNNIATDGGVDYHLSGFSSAGYRCGSCYGNTFMCIGRNDNGLYIAQITGA